MFKILYVEDNEDNAAMLSAWLEIEGDLEVIVATNGAQGVELAVREAPDLVLMDLYLPGMTGFEAARQIRANGASRGIPIIALSAHAMEDDRVKALAAGCDEFETKPIVYSRLIAKIRRLLPRRDTSDRSRPEGGAQAGRRAWAYRAGWLRVPGALLAHGRPATVAAGRARAAEAEGGQPRFADRDRCALSHL